MAKKYSLDPDNMRRAFNLRGLKYEEIGEMLKDKTGKKGFLHRKTIYRLLDGERQVDEEELKAVVDVFNSSRDFLLGEETKMSDSDMTVPEPRQSTSEVYVGGHCMTRNGPPSGGSKCR